jgi:hypothetical protein
MIVRVPPVVERGGSPSSTAVPNPRSPGITSAGRLILDPRNRIIYFNGCCFVAYRSGESA